jgi:tRNA dimethylallyltransferase
MNKLLVICGPTATGKTGLGIKLAKKYNGELVSADSRQVYQGMDIITGKDRPKETRIWLYDVAEPNQKFSVADYYDLAWKAINDIWKRGKLPILVGGTGFYLKAVLEGIGTMGIGPDWKLRSKLSNYQINELQIYLKKMDRKRWERMNESDRKNPRRLIRAIEIAMQVKSSHSKGIPTGKLKVQSDNSKFKSFDKLLIGLTAPLGVLYKRIDERVEERVKMGAEKELKRLIEKGYHWDNSVLGTTIGYQEWRDFFEGKASKEEVIQRWKYDEHKLARRQMTWFKKVLRHPSTPLRVKAQGKWFEIDKEGWQEEVEKLVGSWYI